MKKHALSIYLSFYVPTHAEGRYVRGQIFLSNFELFAYNVLNFLKLEKCSSQLSLFRI